MPATELVRAAAQPTPQQIPQKWVDMLAAAAHRRVQQPMRDDEHRTQWEMLANLLEAIRNGEGTLAVIVTRSALCPPIPEDPVPCGS